MLLDGAPPPPAGLSAHMFLVIERAQRVHGTGAAEYLHWCNAELNTGFSEGEDGYHVGLMAVHQLPLEIVTRDHIALFQSYRAELRDHVKMQLGHTL